MLGTRLTKPTDAVCGYYRSRPLLLSLGVPLEDALGSNMGRAGGYSDGRDIGVVFNFPNPAGPSPPRTCATASPRSRAASAGSVPSPLRICSPEKLARLAAMSPPGVWKLDGTEIPY